MPHLFSGFYQKRFGGNNKIETVSIKLGNTKGRGSSTRMFNYCKQHSSNPSSCINQFIHTNNLTPDVIDSYIKNYNELNKQFEDKFSFLVKKYNI